MTKERWGETEARWEGERHPGGRMMEEEKWIDRKINIESESSHQECANRFKRIQSTMKIQSDLCM